MVIETMAGQHRSPLVDKFVVEEESCSPNRKEWAIK